MAEADPLWRVQQAARRASGPVSVPTQQRWYREELDRDLSANAGTLEQRERAANRKRITLSSVIAWLMLVILIAAALLAGLLWRDGTLGQLARSTLPSPAAPDGSWIKASAPAGMADPETPSVDAPADGAGSGDRQPALAKSRPKTVQDADSDPAEFAEAEDAESIP